MEKKYGKLYNFYAVSDPRGLASEGWQVPTDAEWTVLTDYLGRNGHGGTEARALKSKSGWNSNGNGTDHYGWLGLPGGSRDFDGSFGLIGNGGCWWSSSQSYTNDAWTRYLYDYDGPVYRNYDNNKEDGFSVRCLRD